MKCTCPSLKNVIVFISFLLGTTLTLLIIHQIFLPILGWIIPSLIPLLYDLAVYGAYPTHEYVTFDLRPPAPNIVQWNEACTDGLILIGPFGDSVTDDGPMILDNKGNLVWMTIGLGTVMNLKIQSYLGEPHLTFWAGNKVGGIGQGHGYMLNSSYDVVHQVAAAAPPKHPDDLRYADLHDFVITDTNTALLTVYNTTTHDLSGMGRPSNGWIVDSLFQEVDISTGKLLFEWRASDHFDPSTSSQYLNPFGGYSQGNPYDFFHINSVQKDRDGNYLISSRHLHAVMTVSGTTGEIIWLLGGEMNVFEDLSSGKATDFKWQHDARWVNEEEGILSLFDNGSAGPIMTDAPESKGILIQIDIEKRTAKLVHEYKSKSGILSASQGSVQVFDHEDGEQHVFVGWGSSAAYSEFALNGDLLCEAHVSAASLYWWERVKSYRVIKNFEWVGNPEYPPTAAMSGDGIYVSWNGATEVGAWQLEGRKEEAGEQDWLTVDIKDKEGFEDSFTLPDESYVAYRVAALDIAGGFLRHSNVVEYVDTRTSKALLWTVGVCAGLGASFGIWLFMTKVPRGQRRKYLWDKHRYRKVPSIEMS